MSFFLPERVSQKIRQYEKQLFFEENTLTIANKQEIFYLLLKDTLRPIIKESLLKLGLEREEIESELYLLCCNLFSGFKAWKRSSVIPYLEAQVPWYLSFMFERLERDRKDLPRVNRNDTYELLDEIYLKAVYFLFENKYLARNLTLPNRYLINRILGLDDKELSADKIAKSIHVERKTLTTKLRELREVIKELSNG